MGLTQQVARIKLGKCPICSKEISYNEFKDEISRREYDISGMCQLCQDEVCTPKEEVFIIKHIITAKKHTGCGYKWCGMKHHCAKHNLCYDGVECPTCVHERYI